jgi:bifunctional DNA-binding transcriptional regulator/antitoxin component of YhaV-PrlF toxin-antitoxin module
MTSLKITAKGQVTLRQDILAHLGVGPKQKIEIEKLPHGRIIIKAATPKGNISDFIGCLAQESGPVLTIDELAEIASQGWAGEE